VLTASIDFGTTNSVVGINDNGKVKMVRLGKESLETKSVLFYSFEDKSFYVGDSAIEELKLESIGRYFVSLKSFLGSAENIETTLGTTTYSISDLISIILRNFKGVLERYARKSIDRVVLGRPVHFNDKDKFLDRQAQERLYSSAIQAGFKEVYFEYEPISASLAYEQSIQKEEIILVADIGGGTTDYTIVRVGGKKKKNIDRRDDILSTHGCYIGGNDFDSEIIRNFVIKHLGYGSYYKNMGKEMQIDYSLYSDFSHWHKFQKMYDSKVINRIEKYIYMAYKKEKISRLLELIKNGLYFDFSEKIIKSKIDLSSKKSTLINMDIFENPFSQNLSRRDFDRVISVHIDKIKTTLNETLQIAGVKSTQIDKVFLTGGSTLTPAVSSIYQELFDRDKLVQTDVFSSVGYGLALGANRS
jgi:hypothetical chaperone protein